METEALFYFQYGKGEKPTMRALIADNTPRARQGMRALLEVWYQWDEVREAVNGAEAVQLAQEFQPDLILMDARMPAMDGLEATRQIKAKWPQIKIIILSVYPDYQVVALEAGADGFVGKSDPPDILRKMLAEVLPEREKKR
jgi:CheY-like chemotaxis protein